MSKTFPQNTIQAKENASMTFDPIQFGSSQKVYREMEDHTVVELSLIDQLEHNLKLMEDLQGRLAFLNTEIRTVLKVQD